MKRNWFLLIALFIAVIGLAGIRPVEVLAQDAPKAAQEEQKPVKKAEPKPALEGKVNINTADAATLEKLPGIGPKLAKEIITYRDANGSFKSVDDLKKVKGIGDKKAASIKDKITAE